MKRPIIGLVAGILATIATVPPASADCFDSTVRISDKAASVVSSVRKHVEDSKGYCDFGTIVDTRYNTLGWYTFDKQGNRLRVTPYDGRFKSESVKYDQERD